MESRNHSQAAGTAPNNDIEDLAKSNRRGSERYRTVCRIARVRRDNDVGLWRVRNISNEGLMLAADIPATVGEPLDISLSEAITLRGTIIWAEHGRCGVAFDEPIDAAAVLQASPESNVRRATGPCDSRSTPRRSSRYATTPVRSILSTSLSKVPALGMTACSIPARRLI